MNEKLEALRRRIEHEDNLVNQRLSWLVASQAFMLTAFAILLNAPLNSLIPAYYAANHLLVSAPCLTRPSPASSSSGSPWSAQSGR